MKRRAGDRRPTAPRFACALTLLSALAVPAVLMPGRARARSDGATLYAQACASCHGHDGRGAEGTAVRVPLPDLADCSFTSREPASDWLLVVAHGGPAVGLSDQMPAFGDALTDAEMRAVLEHVRSFCHDARWPRGELNFRRPIFTAKAFPENEAVVEQRYTNGRGGDGAWLTRLTYERRIGARGQVELTLPFAVNDPDDGPTEGGAGDFALGYKYVLYASLSRLTIAASSLELVVPSGDSDRGLGADTVSFEPSLHLGRGLGPFVLQGQVTGIAPIDEDRADREVRYRLATSYPLGPLRRDWWPTLELEVLQNVTAGKETLLLTPQIYKAIRARGHLALAVGVQVPVAGTHPFDYRVVAFLLWEYLDGGLWW